MVINASVKGIILIVLISGLLSMVGGALTETQVIPSETNVSNFAGETRPFTITVDKMSNFTWSIGGISTINSTVSSFTGTATPGLTIITVNAVEFNSTANVSHTWFWNVTNRPPTAPGFTTVSPAIIVKETGVDITFSINQTDAKTSVYYGNDSSLGSGPVWNNDSGLTRTISLPGLSKNTTYYYRVHLYNGTDTGLVFISNIYNFITPNPTQPNINSIDAKATDISANITFRVDQNDAKTCVNYGTDNGSLISGPCKNESGPSRTIQLNGLTQRTTYFYKIFAYNALNNSIASNSSIYYFVTLDPSPPNISNIVDGIPNENSISISFTVNQTDAKTKIIYGPDDTLSNSTTLDIIRTILLSNLQQATKYYYSIFAYNATNQTYLSNSTVDSFTTKYPSPKISSINPASIPSPEIIVGQQINLSVTIGSLQGGNLNWYENTNTNPLTSESVNASETVLYPFVRNTSGMYNITANLSNNNGSDIRTWTIKVHPTTYNTGNRIWDGSNPNDFGLTYSWTPQSFSGFYYNAKDDVGTEKITLTMDSYSSRTIGTGDLLYSTSPQEVSFTHSGWGSYQVIGFMADKYFAGYSANTSSTNTRPSTDFRGISAISQGGLHRVLIDDDTKQTIAVGGTLALQDGYVLKATDIDLNARTMLLSLLKDGTEVDVSPLSAGETYVYTKTVGGVESLPLIMLRFDSVFSGNELQVAFIKGVFQISQDTTTVRTGDQFGTMEVNGVGPGGITMTNRATIGLSKGATSTIMGDLKIQVANNDSAVRFALTVDRPSNLEVRSTVYRDSDNPPITEWTPYNFGMNIGDTSLGFYYDLDAGVGGEDLKLLNQVSSRSIPQDGLVYTTTPQEVAFTYTGFGKYQAIGFMADRYFAGYTSNSGVSSTGVPINTMPSTDFRGISTIAHGNLHRVLIDDDTKTTIAVGSTISLQEGYVIKATDIDLNARAMLLTLLKDGTEVDVSPLSAGQTYVYAKTVGGTESLPLIMVRFESVFSGQELQVAFLRGIFQISENPTTIQVGNQFGKMEVTSVSSTSITMSNSGSIGLSRNTNNGLMGNIKLKVADTDAALRFYFAVDVTPEMVVNQLAISAPAKVMAGDTLKVKVTAGGKAADNTSLSLDTDMGTTDKNGELNYTIPKTLKAGTYTITAAKTGYEKATKSIQVEKYVDYRLSIEMPSNANQYETITIKVLWNNTAMSGAAVQFDNTSAGTTDSNGTVSYRLETSGTHSITASKTSYISVSRDIDIRAPYSEFKALDINVTPNPVFTGDNFVIKSNITNVGTKSDTLPVNLIINGTAVENRTITLTPGQKLEINFTRQEAAVANVTVEIMGQSNLLVVQNKPINYLLIAAIATVIGAVIIYVLTSKGLLSLDLLKEKFEVLSDKFRNIFKK